MTVQTDIATVVEQASQEPPPDRTVAELRKDLREPEEAREFAISDLRSLGWFIRQIGLLEDQIVKIEKARDQEKAEIELRANQLIRQCDSSVRFLQDRYGEQAQAFVRAETRQLRRKSVPTLWGTAGFRKTQGSVRIEDMDAAVEFAEREGIEVKIKKSVNRTPLHKHIEATGEIPPGCEYEPPEDRFYMRYSPTAEDALEEE